MIDERRTDVEPAFLARRREAATVQQDLRALLFGLCDVLLDPRFRLAGDDRPGVGIGPCADCIVAAMPTSGNPLLLVKVDFAFSTACT